jgi:hypothetical protein
VLLSHDDVIISGNNYAISPVEAGFNYTLSIIDKFDEIVFLKNHKNYSVRLQQSEIEFLLSDRIDNFSPEPLNQHVLNVFGCSHTYGIGHEPVTTAYPYVLSTLLNIDCKNYGLPGKGNYAIENLLNSFSIRDSNLIIQFTDVYRILYMKDDELKQHSIHNSECEIFDPILFNDPNLFYNFKKIVIRTVNRLREGNNKFVITYMCNLENEMDLRCIEFLHGFKEFTSAIGTSVDVARDNAHYGIQSHKLWAERLHKKWIELYG